MTIEKIIPKLVVDGAEAAIRYYSEALGARLLERHEDGARIVFAELEIAGIGSIAVKDADEVDKAAPSSGGSALLLSVTADDPDRTAEAMVAAGGQSIFAVADREYGLRQGRVRDPFGYEWIIGGPLAGTGE